MSDPSSLKQTQTLTCVSDCRISILQWICTYRIPQCPCILLEKVWNRYHPWKSHLKFKSKVFTPFIHGIREARIVFSPTSRHIIQFQLPLPKRPCSSVSVRKQYHQAPQNPKLLPATNQGVHRWHINFYRNLFTMALYYYQCSGSIRAQSNMKGEEGGRSNVMQGTGRNCVLCFCGIQGRFYGLLMYILK